MKTGTLEAMNMALHLPRYYTPAAVEKPLGSLLPSSVPSTIRRHRCNQSETPIPAVPQES